MLQVSHERCLVMFSSLVHLGVACLTTVNSVLLQLPPSRSSGRESHSGHASSIPDTVGHTFISFRDSSDRTEMGKHML